MRHDYIRLDKKSLTADKNGFLNIPVNAARVGVYTYINSDGSKRRELRLPEEVFNEDSMKTLALKPATFEHKGGMINSTTVAKFTVGAVGDAIKQEGDFLTCNMGVHKKDAVDSVLRNLEKGKPMGLSPGYDCDIEEKSGNHPKYGRYDCIQRNIVFNHLTLTENPRGNGCHLRLDSEDAAMIEEDSINTTHDQKVIMTIHKNKIPAYKVGDDHFDSESIEFPQEAESAVNTVLARLSLTEEKATEINGHLDSMTAERDGLKSQLEEKEALLVEQKGHLDSSVTLEKAVESSFEISELVSMGKFSREDAVKLGVIGMKKEIVLKSKRFDSEKLESQQYIDVAMDQLKAIQKQMPKAEESHLDSWEDLNKKDAVTQADETEQLAKMGK